MILAAGRGERLRPLTDRAPKALLEAGGKSLIAWHLGRLASAGIRDVVVNLAHLGGQIEAALGEGGAFGLRLAYSREPEPLETAGGIAFAAPLLGAEPILLLNADIYCDFDLSPLARRSLGERLGHLVLVPNPAHRPGGDFSLTDGRAGDAAAPRYTYAGIAVLRPSLVAEVHAGDKAPLGPILKRAAAGQLSGELHEGVWHDAGTPERLAALRKALA
jgi:MurNAc alpha-1-phosphate uridylyltransferase